MDSWMAAAPTSDKSELLLIGADDANEDREFNLDDVGLLRTLQTLT